MQVGEKVNITLDELCSLYRNEEEEEEKAKRQQQQQQPQLGGFERREEGGSPDDGKLKARKKINRLSCE